MTIINEESIDKTHSYFYGDQNDPKSSCLMGMIGFHYYYQYALVFDIQIINSYSSIYLSDKYLSIEALIIWDSAVTFLERGSFRILLRVLFDLIVGGSLGDFVLWYLLLGI